VTVEDVEDEEEEEEVDEGERDPADPDFMAKGTTAASFSHAITQCDASAILTPWLSVQSSRLSERATPARRCTSKSSSFHLHRAGVRTCVPEDNSVVDLWSCL
jgi:hypothetical protein